MNFLSLSFYKYTIFKLTYRNSDELEDLVEFGLRLPIIKYNYISLYMNFIYFEWKKVNWKYMNSSNEHSSWIMNCSRTWSNCFLCCHAKKCVVVDNIVIIIKHTHIPTLLFAILKEKGTDEMKSSLRGMIFSSHQLKIQVNFW